MKIDDFDDDDVGVITKGPELKDERKTKQPDLYVVMLHNDDYTPFEVVVHVLQKVFQINQDNAIQLMMVAHQTGKVAVGKFTKDIAETKAHHASKIANDMDHPLMFTAEKE